jgi:NAD(P)H-hydrate repair Nnr-like enzyme with NAD(P)H-hydrate dehydratase domain
MVETASKVVEKAQAVGMPVILDAVSSACVARCALTRSLQDGIFLLQQNPELVRSPHVFLTPNVNEMKRLCTLFVTFIYALKCFTHVFLDRILPSIAQERVVS